MFKNTAGQRVTLFAYNVATGFPQLADAANQLFYVSKDDGAFTAVASNAGVPTEDDTAHAKGLYTIALSAAETNADKLKFSGTSSTANVVLVPTTIYTVPPLFTTMSVDTLGRVSLNLLQSLLAFRNQDGNTTPNINDALQGAFCEAYGTESESGTSYVKTAIESGLVLRTFALTLDGNSNPTARS